MSTNAKYIGAAPTAASTEEDDEAASFGDIVRIEVGTAQHGWRLDRALAALHPQYSRSRIQQWIADGQVSVVPPRPSTLKARDPVYSGEIVSIVMVAAPQDMAFAPQPMPLDIVYEDAALRVIDKPPGLVVHPAAGHWSGTLLNGLLACDSTLAALPRAGIVHRLDADTSGLMVVARTLEAQTDLVRQLQARSVTREYWAVVYGTCPLDGTIDAPLARDPRNPLRFAVRRGASARDARTHFRRIATVLFAGRSFSWVTCRLDTGRTHQIRVHMEHLGHPLVGDPVYRRGRPALSAEAESAQVPWASFERQALHACRLGLRHPDSGKACTWFRAPRTDLRQLMRQLGFGRTDRPRNVW